MKLNRGRAVLGSTALALSAFAACAQLEMLPDHKTQDVFGGGPGEISIAWRNRGEQAVESTMSLRLYQTTSATAALLGQKTRTNIKILPGQTILENPRVDFPDVRVETAFLIQWLGAANHVLGTTEVIVYPTNLLEELKALAGGSPLGVFDPANQLKPLLKSLDIAHQDLLEDGTDRFSGKLAIFGPFESKTQMCAGVSKRIEALAAKGVAVVWIQPPPERRDKLQPSFYPVPFRRGAVVIVQAELVADLAKRPQSQLGLIHFARLALNPEPICLPNLTSQP